METHATSNYSADRITLLTRLERDIPRAYVDSKGIATFGVGLNLRTHGELLLQALGFDFAGEYLTGTALQEERAYGRQLLQRFRQDYAVGSYAANIADNNPAKAAFDAVLLERQQYFLQLQYDPANFVSQEAYDSFILSLEAEFEIASADERHDLLISALDGYTVPNIDGNSKVVDGYESLLDQWLEKSGVGDAQPELWFQDSKERLALLSLTFNSPTLLGPSLTTALLDDNRTEAWYEIRYNSNAGGAHASRRFLEADMFGLYDEGAADNITEEQAKEVYRMYASHRETILSYEGDYLSALGVAQTAGAAVGVTVQGLEAAFRPATDLFGENYLSDFGITVDVDYRDIQVAAESGSSLIGNRRMGYDIDEMYSDRNDLLIGGDRADFLQGRGGDDVLHGGGGNDVLDGGTGENWLYGGDGADTYVLTSADDTTNHISDVDTDNYVIVDGQLIAAAFGDGSGTWTTADGLNQLTHNSQLTITNSQTGSQTIIENWQENGDFGIHLFEESSAEFMPDRTIEGDRAPEDQAPNTDGVQLGYDDLNNVITTSDAEANRKDSLYDSTDKDLIFGKGGDDFIYAWRGGDDKLDGGAGADIIFAGTGDDIVIGGEGSDVLHGEEGRDRIYGKDEISLNDAFELQDAMPSGLRGDFLNGLTDDDILVGDSGNDVLSGGRGDDLILGGAGDDTIRGDQEFNMAALDWSVERSIIREDGSTVYFTMIDQVMLIDHDEGGNDIIYAGGGEDWVSAEKGDDFIDGGSGNDVLFGEAGHDILLGGEGEDILNGDSGSVPADEHGNDYLDGGDGNDALWGGGGNDVLIGGTGDDKLYGDDGDDALDGGDGNDTLVGGKGHDVLNGGSGADSLYGDPGTGEDDGDSGAGEDDGDDVLSGGADDDKLFGYGGNDLLSGDDGNDLVIGGAGMDTLYGGDGDDQIAGDEGGSDTGGDADVIDAGAGNDFVDAQGGNDIVEGGAGDDTLLGGEDHDALYGGSGYDWLQGGNGNDVVDGGSEDDVLFGEAGDDVLFGGAGSDQLLGGTGNDYLFGGDGNDVYYYALGEGIDHISDSGGYDLLFITNGLMSNIVRLDVGSMAIVFDDGSELHIDDFDPNNPHASSIEYIQFADGTVVTPGQLVDMFGFQVEGTPGEDVLSGTSLGEAINAYESDDAVTARGGDDAVDLGDGNDFADGGDGDDVVLGGNGDDSVFGGIGNDFLHGGAGADRLYGEAGTDHLYGDDGDDVLSGGSGNDTLEGGAGRDSYLFGAGDGRDVVIDGNGMDQVRLTGGLLDEDVAFQRQGDDLIVAVKGTQDQLTVRDWFVADGSTWSVMLGDGTVLDSAAVEERLASNNAPLAQPDAACLSEGTTAPVVVNVLANDSDPEGSPLRVTNPGTYVGSYGTLTLLANGSATYVLDTASPAVQGMMGGQGYSDTFQYAVTDDDRAGPQTSTSTVQFDIVGENDAPVAYVDTATVSEDGVLAVSGNVLANDADVDIGDSLRVASAGTYEGTYGVLTVAANGDFVYALDNAAAQSLGRDQTVTENFGYLAADSAGATAGAGLAVAVQGSNDAPDVAAPLADQSAAPNSSISLQVPAGSFVDPDQGDTLAYSARLADGTELPSWLVFDPATQTFSGRVPRDAVGYLDIEVTAIDSVGGTVRMDDLSTSDVFRLNFDAAPGGGGGGGGNGGGSTGNAGVGNGSDAPPPGHEYNFNDGPGTSPGAPGAQGGNGYRPDLVEAHVAPQSAVPGSAAAYSSVAATQDRAGGSTDNASLGGSGVANRASPKHDFAATIVEPAMAAWFADATGPDDSAPFPGSAITWSNGQGEAEPEGLGWSNSVLLDWAQVDTRLRSHLLQAGDDAVGHFPGLGLGRIDGAGFLGSSLPVADDSLSLKGNGLGLRSFQGLTDGFVQAT